MKECKKKTTNVKIFAVFGKDLFLGSVNMPFEAEIQIEDSQFEKSEKE